MYSHQKKLIINIERQLQSWQQTTDQMISITAINHFLSSVKLTGRIVGLIGISQCAKDLLVKLEKIKTTSLSSKTASLLLSPLEACTNISEEHTEPIAHLRTGEEPLIVLVDEDVTLLAYLKSEMEKQGWMVIATVNPHKALEAFYKMEPDCFITDINMALGANKSMFHLIQKKITEAFIPTIVMSSSDEEGFRKMCFKFGADDFIIKPFHLEEFLLRVEQKLKRREQVKHMLLIDEMTGIYNRKYLVEAFERSIQELERYTTPFSFALLDLDHFKKINDTYGHVTGDVVLKEFTKFISENCRHGDVLVRYGGEEFIMMLPKTTLSQAEVVVNRLLETFSKEIFTFERERFHVTFSAGLVEVTNPVKPWRYWLSLADDALYEGKRNGRNQVVVKNEHNNLSSNRPKVHMTIVENDDLVSSILKSYVKKHFADEYVDLHVHTFKCAKQFLSQIKEDYHPHLLIIDADMPHFDGYEALRMMSKENLLEQYTIVMLIDDQNKECIAKALRLGADDYLSKPFSIQDFHTRLKQYIHRLQ
ncbi:diguanylate cyclase [Bacillus tianshenii]|nr:diguanylate cyclase [Bacillus tianshenii]